jgi:hypothetical protein
MGRREEAPPWEVGRLGRKRIRGLGSCFVPDLGFTEDGYANDRDGNSVYRPRSCLAPLVIDLNREGGSDKKINRSDGCGQKRDEKNYCRTDRTEERRASSADSLVGRVG